jgi:hypothetical protein
MNAKFWLTRLHLAIFRVVKSTIAKVQQVQVLFLIMFSSQSVAVAPVADVALVAAAPEKYK